jgi:drug/metabolite transporter (DMT)-like permease
VVLLAVMAWAGFVTGTKPLAERYGGRVGTGAPLLAGTAMYLPFGLLLGDLGRFEGLSAGGWAAVAYLVVMTNVVSWMMYAWALARAEASRVAIWSNMQPVLTALLAWWIYGERLTAPFLVGGALVVAGVLLTQRG